MSETAPPVPRRHGFSRGSRIVAGLCALVLGGYATVAWTGWEPIAPGHDTVPATVRASPGGYRSFHFWHSGYHGGK
ncbi:MAG TPA: putative cross-wall-targeting lipoprotein signal domain-containing protein [Kofleriaceae bacterium]|jgi:hypothetical protein